MNYEEKIGFYIKLKEEYLTCKLNLEKNPEKFNRKEVESYMNGLIKGMVYLNDDIQSVTMEDGTKIDNEEDTDDELQIKVKKG